MRQKKFYFVLCYNSGCCPDFCTLKKYAVKKKYAVYIFCKQNYLSIISKWLLKIKLEFCGDKSFFLHKFNIKAFHSFFLLRQSLSSHYDVNYANYEMYKTPPTHFQPGVSIISVKIVTAEMQRDKFWLLMVTIGSCAVCFLLALSLANFYSSFVIWLRSDVSRIPSLVSDKFSSFFAFIISAHISISVLSTHFEITHVSQPLECSWLEPFLFHPCTPLPEVSISLPITEQVLNNVYWGEENKQNRDVFLITYCNQQIYDSPGAGKLFGKGPGSKYFMLCRPSSLFHNYRTL